MSTVRVKRKHVLDSDSDESEDEPAPGAKAQIARSDAETRVSEEARGGECASPPGPSEPQRKRLMSAADRAAARRAEAASAPITIDDDEAGDDRIVLDLRSPEDEGDEDARGAGSDSEAYALYPEDPALARCAQISRRLRDALGRDVARRDGPLSPGGAKRSGSAAARALVTADDVFEIAGEASRARTLKPYQMIGVNFLLLLDEQDVPGAILADEMGLGKTAQTVAYLACSRRRKEKGVGGWASVGNEKKQTSALAALVASQKDFTTRGFKKGAPVNEPALVVAPASLLENWRRELRTWAPALRVGFFHGKEGQAATRAAAERSGGGGGAFDVLIACYSLFERDSADQKQHRAWLRSMTYSHLVLDEAHLVKNRATQRAKRLDAVAARARRRLLLTGTPLQNNLLELESLIHLVLPGLLKPGALAGDARDGDGEAADVGDGDGDAGLEARRRAARVKTILKPFILRRLKEEVATELIAKKREKRVEEMTEVQATLYETTLEEAREERRRKRRTAAATNGDAVTTKGGATNDGATNDHASKEDQSSFMTLPANGGTSAVGAKKTRQLFVRLRKIANHPLLVRARYSEADLERIARVCHKSGVFGYEASLDRVRAHVFDDAYSDVDLHNLCGDAATRGQLSDLRLPPEAFSESGKTRALLSLLSDVRAKGSRPLIFSQWKIVLDILEVALRDAGFPFVRLDGATATEERQTICDAYNDADSTAFAFLLSTRAGGQGLNLTSADTVIIHDCDFNPQIDRQAEDRCHRLGQRRPVTVIRLVTRDSVDERIVAVAEKKLDLDAAILSDPKAVAAEENRAVHEIMEELLAG